MHKLSGAVDSRCRLATYTPCELTAVAVALRASSSYDEGSRSNLHSLACASTDSLRLIFEFERSEKHIDCSLCEQISNFAEQNISSCEATYTPCELQELTFLGAVRLCKSEICARGAICTRSLTSELADSLRLIFITSQTCILPSRRSSLKRPAERFLGFLTS